MFADRDYSRFAWEDLGEAGTGRPNLGQEAPVAACRLLLCTVRDALSDKLGTAGAAEVLIAAGRAAGEQFCLNVLDVTLDFADFVFDLQRKLRDLKIGLLRIEKIDATTLELTATVAEDLACSGLPVSEQVACRYNEGFLAGILEAYTGKEFRVSEVDCWASGERVSRFAASPLGPNDAWTVTNPTSCTTPADESTAF